MNDSSSIDGSQSVLQQRVRTVSGKELLFDNEGFLWRAEDWTEDVARGLASECGLYELTDEQWRLIRFMRDYFFYNGRSPLNRHLKAGLGMSIMKLEALFPGGVRLGARRVAGLPNPKSCI